MSTITDITLAILFSFTVARFASFSNNIKKKFCKNSKGITVAGVIYKKINKFKKINY